MVWVSITCDDAATATGSCFVFVTNSNQQNYIYSFKKQGGVKVMFAK